ncbi:MAG: BMP family ABC transporter substrate-binding protein [Agathobacter sp.]|nr:BMP family ABC transporter substrate-binding protein [Agathobacter sp.]
MSELEYQEALKLGKKEQKKCVAEGRFPYLPVLDEILEHQDVQTEQKLGLMQIPLEYVVGTSTRNRTYAFAANFMPILETGTEFASKWINLAEAQVEEGIRDPIIVYEFLNRYYVVEGNKRVSVLKYYKADSISAIVTRKVPKPSEDEEIKLYYELMKFQEDTGINSIEFSHLGEASTLVTQVGVQVPWDSETKETFRSKLFYFSKAYEERGGKKLPIKLGDAIATFIRVYGYGAMLLMSQSDFAQNIQKCWSEFAVLTEKERVDLVLHPTEVQGKKHLLRHLLSFSSQKKFMVAFLYPKSAKESDWIYSHDLGRSYLEETFPEQISTICVEGVTEDDIEATLNDVILKGADIIFEVGPQMMKASLKVALEHPEVKILNCSLNEPHKNIRTYYARMYEAKFISGMIAGAMAENDKIAYVADYPIYGMIANINAFALGAACVNPRAKVYVDWSTRKDYDLDKFLSMNDIHYVSNQDMITPIAASREFGLYRYEDGVATNLVMPLWNWGVFYEKLIHSILAGAYETEGDAEVKALNYWWGISAGVIDLIYSKNVPKGVKRLAEHIEYDISVEDVVPFFGEIYAQDGTLKNEAEQSMSPEDIMKMDWLVENVIGEIPSIDLLQEQAKTVVELKGVEEKKES